MLICHCRAVNDRAVRDAIEAGARAPQDVANHCGAGSQCGGCLPALLELLAEHQSATEAVRAQPSFA